MFTKASLESLKERIDLIEVLSMHIDLKKQGGAYKALCPFHQEKTPSFTIQKGDSHYHCYGCGAHGDAIQFLTQHLHLSFLEAVETLAAQFHVLLERQEQPEGKGPDKIALKDGCAFAARFFHAYLLYTEEGQAALSYLYKRGINLDYIHRFQVGFAPAEGEIFSRLARAEKIPEPILVEAGLLTGQRRPFFRDRITFPIRNSAGSVIGFSARKYKGETFGGKYINTPETPIFKKSKLLFGLNYSRLRIAKERKVIIVEGQIDCLKLIEAGLNLTVAALGTAFGESHVEELKRLLVREAYLLFDSDEAGQAATAKAGDLLQKKGVDVYVVQLPPKSDPDTFLNQYGTLKLIERLRQAENYLSFQVAYLSRQLSSDSPAAKAELVSTIRKQIEQWEDPILVHESLRRLASLVHVPEDIVGIKKLPPTRSAISHVPDRNSPAALDTHRVLEIDLLRWLVLKGERFLPTARYYLSEKHFWTPSCRSLYLVLLEKGVQDLLSLASSIEDHSVIDEILRKKINQERAEFHFLHTVQKMLDREWLQEREAIKREIQQGNHNEQKVLELAREFDALKQQRPIMQGNV